MNSPLVPPYVIGVIDLGSNSVRLMLVRIHKAGTYTVLNQVKYMVRLGQGSFTSGKLQPQNMRTTLHVLQRMADMCAAYHAVQIVPMATAAVRDAENGPAFMKKVRSKTGLNFEVISGREEARLIWLGVSAGLDPSPALRMYIDIGGGSTEMVLATQAGYKNLESLKLGCVRLTNMFFEGQETISQEKIDEAKAYILAESALPRQRMLDIISQNPLAEIIGSSGTIENLAAIAALYEHSALPGQELLKPTKKSAHAPESTDTWPEATPCEGPLPLTCSASDKDLTVPEMPLGTIPAMLTRESLAKVVTWLCASTPESRSSIPGVSPRRAEVLLAGALLLHTLMEALNLPSIHASTRTLQEGLVLDYLMRTHTGFVDTSLSLREQSVVQLGKRCRYEEEHSRHVATLSQQLFQSASQLLLHSMGEQEAELLRYAALLHDIGIFISFANHHAHSHYLIQHTELLGFTRQEIDLIATLTFFHRKRPPRKHEFYQELPEESRQMVRLLSLFLTLAERLDKTHCRLVKEATFIQGEDGLTLLIRTNEPCPLELEALKSCDKWLTKSFEQPVRLEHELIPQKTKKTDKTKKSPKPAPKKNQSKK